MIKKKKYIILLISIIAFVLIGIVVFSIFQDKNKLNSKEKSWLKNNSKQFIDVRVLNDVNTFGFNGQGVFFDFLNDFKKKYSLGINVITYNHGAISPGISFQLNNTVSPEDVVLYKDHFVVVSKTSQAINNINDLNDKKIGVLNTDLSYVSYYLSHNKITFEQYNDLGLLVESLPSLDHIIVPLNQALDLVLNNGFFINYHLSDINQYYFLGFSEDQTLNSIMRKYYAVWSKENFNDSYNQNLLATFIKGLKYTEADFHALTSKVYNYGFVGNAPYEILSGEEYSGVIGEYITGFTRMSGIEFNYKKYNNYDSLNKAANNNRVDLYYSSVNLANQFEPINTGMDLGYVILTNNNNEIVINSLESLKGKTIHVLKNSLLHRYFSDLMIATIETYEYPNDLFSLVKDSNNIIVVDEIGFDYNNNNRIKNAIAKYRGEAKGYEIDFKSNASEKFVRLYGQYVRSVDDNLAKNIGIAKYNQLLNSSSLVGTIIRYLLIIILSGVLLSFVVYRFSTRLKLSSRIKKDDKMRFIDLLTSLKNRNYLNKNITKWDQNSIYPQTAIIIDLNNIKFINDTYGYEEGDRQIKAAADILIKTQLDNTEIIRTDGNEFLIYLLEYSEKQVSSYIHKLSKEFNSLPYEYGAAIGYSMIENELKLIDDAINEATLDMRNNKLNGANNVAQD